MSDSFPPKPPRRNPGTPLTGWSAQPAGAWQASPSDDEESAKPSSFGQDSYQRSGHAFVDPSVGPRPVPAPDYQKHEAHQRKVKRSSSRKNLLEWGLLMIGAVIVAVVVKTFLLQAFYIPSESMEPTLKIGDRVLVNKLSYKTGTPKRSQIVVFDRPTAVEGQAFDGAAAPVKHLIKRIVAVGGDTVEAKNNQLVVNGEVVDESYLPTGTVTRDFGPISVPEGSVFVMGDNRTNSTDSRVFGPIEESAIVGRAFVLVWPLSSFEFL